MQPQELSTLALDLRIAIIDMITEAKSGHPGGSLSAIDLMTALFFKEMRGMGQGSLAPNRDHFILSKGHAVPALYAILAEKGFISHADLKTLRRTGSKLQGHPDRVRMPIVEASTGSLGQGLSVAQGMALGLRDQGSRIFCLLGDGEIQEGQIWEAALSAPKFKLSNLCAILDLNNGQIDGPVSDVMPIEPIADKWRAFGWHVIQIDGHDMNQILKAYEEARSLQEKGGTQPVFIIARTIKGKGVSFMENNLGWHGMAPQPEQAQKAIEELKKAGGKSHV